MIDKANYYGELCSKMYDLLHPEAPEDELAFYMSYAGDDTKILECMCGSGRFLVPMLKKGYDITGMDASAEMLSRLLIKAPQACVIESTIQEFETDSKYDLIMITSGSVSLITDKELCVDVLANLRTMLTAGGMLVFAVDTVASIEEYICHYEPREKVTTEEGYDLILKTKTWYEEKTQTQMLPSVYLVEKNGQLLHIETMDYRLHLYRFGEMEQMLKEAGFKSVKTFSSFDRTPASSDNDPMFIFECRA